MKSLILLLLSVCLASGQINGTNIRLSAVPAQSTASSLPTFLGLTAGGVGQTATPTKLWEAVVLTGTVDTSDITGISAFSRTFLDDTDAVSVRNTLGIPVADYFFLDTFKANSDSTDLATHLGERGSWRTRGVIGSDGLYINVSATGYNAVLPFGSGYGWYLNDRPPAGADYSVFGILKYFSDDNTSAMGIGVRCNYAMSKGVFAGWDNLANAWVIRKTTSGTGGITDADTESATLVAGQEYTMELKAQGSTFTLYVDSTQVAQATDASFNEAGAAFVWGRNSVADETHGVALASAWGVDFGVPPVVVNKDWGFFLEGESLDGTVNYEWYPTGSQLLTKWMGPRVAQNWAIDGRSLASASANTAGMAQAFALMSGCKVKAAYFMNGVNDLFSGGGGTGVSETMATSAGTAITNAKAAGYHLVFIGNIIKTGAVDGITNGETERVDYNTSDLPAVVAAAGGADAGVYIINLADDPNFSDVDNSRIYVQSDVGGIDDTHLTPLGGRIRARIMQTQTEAAINALGNFTYLQASTGAVVGSITPVSSAALTVTSTTKGLLLPRMTKTQRDAISSPVAGLAVYQTDNTPGLRVYNGTNWMKYTEATD